MLGLGWTEMLVIGVVALIVIGPKDLPVVMHRVGQIFGQIRRMGNEFQREINKTTGLDEVRNLRNSITAPLKQTSDEIRREFNSMTATGPKPSGRLKPADPKAESVVDEIKAAAGMTPTAEQKKPADQIAAESGFKPPQPAVKAAKAERNQKAAVKKATARAKAAPTPPVTSAELAPLDDAQPTAESMKKAVKKPAKTTGPAAKKPAKASSATPAAKKAAPRKRAAPKPKPNPDEAGKAGNE